MTFDWQTFAALAAVLTAALYLVRRTWRTFAKKRAGGCGSCGSCPASSGTTSTGASAAGKPLVQLETFAKPRSRS